VDRRALALRPAPVTLMNHAPTLCTQESSSSTTGRGDASNGTP
jgi:hypothetical protein